LAACLCGRGQINFRFDKQSNDKLLTIVTTVTLMTLQLKVALPVTQVLDENVIGDFNSNKHHNVSNQLRDLEFNL
jgi:hypothetical protein